MVGQPLSSHADCNCLAVRQAARYITQFYDQYLGSAGLRTTQYGILQKLKRQGPMSINALAADRAAPWLRRMRKRLIVGAGTIVLSGAAAWYGWAWWNVGRFVQRTDDAYVGGEVTTIASKVAGFIDTIAVTDNELVKAGDLLVKLDDRDYRAQLARADATVAGS